jgi:TusA-related sulfurtransferase
MIRTDKTLEIKGRLSDRAETVTRHTLSSLTSGQVLTIVTTDRSAKIRLSPLCESLGCVMLGILEEGGTLYVQIRR